MKKVAFLFVALWLCAMAASAAEITFLDKYDQALTAAKAQDAKILIKFYTDW